MGSTFWKIKIPQNECSKTNFGRTKFNLEVVFFDTVFSIASLPLPGGLQRFVSIHSAIRDCYSVPARRRSALTIRYHRLVAFDIWNVVISVAWKSIHGLTHKKSINVTTHFVVNFLRLVSNILISAVIYLIGHYPIKQMVQLNYRYLQRFVRIRRQTVCDFFSLFLGG